ncbi:MAG: glutathione S-transferase N-terminal domain-containing protein [Actinomycetota bacterium]|nr:glutathione S-transferase N-terminal domain-containing protein [Actinomycetota bacterium]MDQ5817229.1 glutathione S-transferase N-terminal domain-containing protein [Actinomycetota bacterium]
MDQKPVVIYVRHRSPYCWRAKRLFRRKGYAFEVVEVSSDRELPAPPTRTTVNRTVPQVFVDGRLVDGFDVIKTLNRTGELDRLVRGEV